jgi:hypothetical protein
MSFTFAKLSRCLLRFSAVGRLDQCCAVDEDASNPHVDEACTPTNITFSSMRSVRISSTYFSTALIPFYMHSRDQISQVGELLSTNLVIVMMS